MYDNDDLQLRSIHNRAILHLKASVSGRATPFTIPPSLSEHCRLLTLAPGEWLLISDTHSAQILHEHTRFVCEGIASVNSSSALSTVKLEGHGVRDVLAKCCGLDFHRSCFPLGSCARTRLAGLPVILDYIELKPRFELYVGCSYLSYMWSYLNDALGSKST